MQYSLHARNHDFVWNDHAAPFRWLDADQVRAFDEQGFLVLEDVFDAATMQRAIAEIDPIEAKVEAFLQTRPDGKMFIARAGEITFSTHLVLRSPFLREFVSGPAFQGLCRDLIGPDVRLYWDQSVYKKPGTEVPFPWHQDNGYTYVEPQQYLTCWVALTDATEENGCPWVVPGLHRQGTLAHRTSDLGFECLEDVGDAAVPAPVRAGGIVVFSSLTPHATGPNRSEAIRKSYIVQFAPDGAVVHTASGPQGQEDLSAAGLPASHPDRQFAVLRAGEPPEPPEEPLS